MPGENGGELAGFLGEMVMGGLEAFASGREGRGERREVRPAGLEILGQIAAQRLPENLRNGMPSEFTKEGMMQWAGERAAAATAAAAERLAKVAAPSVQAAPRARNSVTQGQQIRSFAEGDNIRSFAEGERIYSFATHE